MEDLGAFQDHRVGRAAHEIRRAVLVCLQTTAFPVIEERALAEVGEQVAAQILASLGMVDLRWLADQKVTPRRWGGRGCDASVGR
jgi:hypothetical protein